jgi:hypothetical protein
MAVTFLPIFFAAASSVSAPAGDEDICAFVHELARRSKADTAIAARNQCNLPRQFHIRLLFSGWLIVVIHFPNWINLTGIWLLSGGNAMSNGTAAAST